MAFCDYHACDNCGERKTFYDADMSMAFVDGAWRYGYAKGGADYPAFPGYRAYAFCTECEKTHEIVIQEKPIVSLQRLGQEFDKEEGK